MRWSTTGAGAFVRLAVIPLGGVAGFLLETQQAEPRWLIVAACLVMMGVLPASALFEGRRSTAPPALTPPPQLDPPPSGSLPPGPSAPPS